MDANEVWKSLEIKDCYLKILGLNNNGTVSTTFDFGINPKRTHNYTKDYIEKYYVYAGYSSIWVLGNGFKNLSPRPVLIEYKPNPIEPKKIEIDPFDAIDPEKVLFGDYTGDKKVNEWREI